jgi:hypothetical protein
MAGTVAEAGTVKKAAKNLKTPQAAIIAIATFSGWGPPMRGTRCRGTILPPT